MSKPIDLASRHKAHFNLTIHETNGAEHVFNGNNNSLCSFLAEGPLRDIEYTCMSL